MGWWSVGKDLLTGHLLGPEAGSSVPAPVFFSLGNSSLEWLPPCKYLAQLNWEVPESWPPGSGNMQIKYQQPGTPEAPRTQSGRTFLGGT